MKASRPASAGDLIADSDMASVVTEALQVFGSSVCSVILYYLEVKMKVRRDEVHRNPEALVKVLREIFGPLSSFIEEELAQRIAIKLGLRKPAPLTQLLASISKGIGPRNEITVKAKLRGSSLDIIHRLATRLQKLGATLTELRLERGMARLKAEGGSLFTTNLAKYYREVVAELEERQGFVEVSLKILLPGALLSEEEKERVRGEVEELLESLASPTSNTS